MKRLSGWLLLFVLPFCAAAQKVTDCSASRTQRLLSPHAKSTLASPLLDSYDVKHLFLELNLSNKNTDVSGFGETQAIVTNPSGLGTYAFELDSVLTIDSAFINGSRRNIVSLSRNVRAATGLAIPPGGFFTARIYYHGTAPAGSGFFTQGVIHASPSATTDITYTLSDPYLAKDWWPCKQSLTDKIDSADIWIRVPNGTMAGSNGALARVISSGPSFTEFQWKTRYPIDYYLISASVAPYVSHTQTVHFTGSTDTMPVVHFVYDTAGFNPVNGKAIDSTPYMVDYLSTLYGRYPFWKEKYGHCIAPLGGGMENQTMTTLGAFATPLIAHELGHQWWGDCVTYGSWRDIWLSEGFASYTEQLYVEHFWGAAAAQNYRYGVFRSVMGAPDGTVYVDDTTNTYRIFDTRLTYNKGAAVAHMLRFIAPGDSVYFAGLRAFQQKYAFKNATTADFQAVMETAYGRRLDTFFNQWIYGEGYPTYATTYNQRAADVWIRLDQTTSKPSSVAAFALPVPLLVHSDAGDTLITVYLSAASALYHFKWSKTVTGVEVDPKDNIVNRDLPFSDYDPSLGVGNSGANELAGIQVSPNPSGERWMLSNIPAGTTLQLADVTGRTVWMRKAAPARLSIECSALPAGIYTLSIRGADGHMIARKLEKR